MPTIVWQILIKRFKYLAKKTSESRKEHIVTDQSRFRSSLVERTKTKRDSTNGHLIGDFCGSP